MIPRLRTSPPSSSDPLTRPSLFPVQRGRNPQYIPSPMTAQTSPRSHSCHTFARFGCLDVSGYTFSDTPSQKFSFILGLCLLGHAFFNLRLHISIHTYVRFHTKTIYTPPILHLFLALRNLQPVRDTCFLCTYSGLLEGLLRVFGKEDKIEGA